MVSGDFGSRLVSASLITFIIRSLVLTIFSNVHWWVSLGHGKGVSFCGNVNNGRRITY